METEFWYVRPTGHMTLSILSRVDGFQILRADLLTSHALPPGDDGQLLLRLWNDLALLAAIPSLLTTDQLVVEYRDRNAGHSPFPWQVAVNPGSLRLSVVDSRGRRIADRKFPKRMGQERQQQLIDALMRGVAQLNAVADRGSTLIAA